MLGGLIVLLEDSVKEFVFECEIKKYTWKTIKGYKNGLEYLVNYLKHEHNLKELEEIQTRHLKAYFMWQTKKGRKETYLNGVLKAFRSFFKYHLSEGNIQSNPVLKVSWMREPKTIIKTFSDDEVRGMLTAYPQSDYISVRNRAILAMLFDTGIRNYELCTLSNDAIKENYIVIFGKGKKERQVGKSPYLAKILMKYDTIKKYNFEYRNINTYAARTIEYNLENNLLDDVDKVEALKTYRGLTGKNINI